MLIWQPENFLMPIWYDESLICISCNNLKFLFLTRNLCNLQTPEDLWANHSKMVQPKPHRKDSPSWKAIQKVVFILLSFSLPELLLSKSRSSPLATRFVCLPSPRFTHKSNIYIYILMLIPFC